MQTQEVVAGDEVDTVGLQFSTLPPNGLVVKSVTPGSWADVQGFKPEQKIWRVNGHDVTEITLAELKVLVKERPLRFDTSFLPKDDVVEYKKSAKVESPTLVDISRYRRPSDLRAHPIPSLNKGEFQSINRVVNDIEKFIKEGCSETVLKVELIELKRLVHYTISGAQLAKDAEIAARSCVEELEHKVGQLQSENDRLGKLPSPSASEPAMVTRQELKSRIRVAEEEIRKQKKHCDSLELQLKQERSLLDAEIQVMSEEIARLVQMEKKAQGELAKWRNVSVDLLANPVTAVVESEGSVMARKQNLEAHALHAKQNQAITFLEIELRGERANLERALKNQKLLQAKVREMEHVREELELKLKQALMDLRARETASAEIEQSLKAELEDVKVDRVKWRLLAVEGKHCLNEEKGSAALREDIINHLQSDLNKLQEELNDERETATRWRAQREELMELIKVMERERDEVRHLLELEREDARQLEKKREADDKARSENEKKKEELGLQRAKEDAGATDKLKVEYELLNTKYFECFTELRQLRRNPDEREQEIAKLKDEKDVVEFKLKSMRLDLERNIHFTKSETERWTDLLSKAKAAAEKWKACALEKVEAGKEDAERDKLLRQLKGDNQDLQQQLRVHADVMIERIEADDKYQEQLRSLKDECFRLERAFEKQQQKLQIEVEEHEYEIHKWREAATIAEAQAEQWRQTALTLAEPDKANVAEADTLEDEVELMVANRTLVLKKNELERQVRDQESSILELTAELSTFKELAKRHEAAQHQIAEELAMVREQHMGDVRKHALSWLKSVRMRTVIESMEAGELQVDPNSTAGCISPILQATEAKVVPPELDDIDRRLIAARAEVKRLEEEKATEANVVPADLDEIDNRLMSVKAEIKRLEAEKANIQEREQASHEVDQNPGHLQNRIDESEELVRSLKEELSSCKAKIRKLEQASHEVEQKPRHLQNRIDEMEELVRSLKKELSSCEELEELVRSSKKELSSCKAEFLDKELERLERHRKLIMINHDLERRVNEQALVILQVSEATAVAKDFVEGHRLARNAEVKNTRDESIVVEEKKAEQKWKKDDVDRVVTEAKEDRKALNNVFVARKPATRSPEDVVRWCESLSYIDQVTRSSLKKLVLEQHIDANSFALIVKRNEFEKFGLQGLEENVVSRMRRNFMKEFFDDSSFLDRNVLLIKETSFGNVDVTALLAILEPLTGQVDAKVMREAFGAVGPSTFACSESTMYGSFGEVADNLEQLKEFLRRIAREAGVDLHLVYLQVHGFMPQDLWQHLWDNLTCEMVYEQHLKTSRGPREAKDLSDVREFELNLATLNEYYELEVTKQPQGIKTPNTSKSCAPIDTWKGARQKETVNKGRLDISSDDLLAWVKTLSTSRLPLDLKTSLARTVSQQQMTGAEFEAILSRKRWADIGVDTPIHQTYIRRMFEQRKREFREGRVRTP